MPYNYRNERIDETGLYRPIRIAKGYYELHAEQKVYQIVRTEIGSWLWITPTRSRAANHTDDTCWFLEEAIVAINQHIQASRPKRTLPRKRHSPPLRLVAPPAIRKLA